jgi:PAS domain S-box-containing protein
MVKFAGKTLPWAILLAAIFGAVVLYFAAMLEVTGRISEERDGLQKLSRDWLRIELAIAERTRSDSRDNGLSALAADFQRHLEDVIDLPWLSVLRKAYPPLRVQLETLSTAGADLVSQLALTIRTPTKPGTKTVDIESELDRLLDWISAYSMEQMKAFRVLLVFLAASLMLSAVLLLGFGNLVRIREARFLAAIDSMSDAVILTDADHVVIHANPTANELFKSNADRLEGKPLPDTLTRNGARHEDEGVPSIDVSSDNGTEAMLTDSTGRRRAVSLKVESVREPSGKSRGFVYLIRDLTEWRRLVATIASTFVSLQIEDTENAVRTALDEAASLCGAEVRDLVLFSRSNDGPSSSLSPLLESWVRKVAAGGEPVFASAESGGREDKALFAEESLAWVASIPLVFAGQVTGAIALASRSAGPPWGTREMTVPRILGSLVIELLTKKWAMREMNRLGVEYRDLVEHANVPIWGVDDHGNLNEWNRAAATLTGYEKSRILGQPAESVVSTEDGRVEFGFLLARILAGERITDSELTLQSNVRGSATLLVSGSPRPGAAGTVSGALFIGQDISARVAGERRIREQAKALVEVQEIERLRISRDLHDNVAQDLSAARITCETMFDGLEEVPLPLRVRVSRLSGTIASSLESIRTIAYGLRPQDIDRIGLVSSLARLCESFTRTSTLAVAFQSAGVDGIPIATDHAVNIYRIAQEALANSRRHAQARSVNVALVHSHPDLILRITDDGSGFDVERTLAHASDQRSMGLLGMQERAAILGATLAVTSKSGNGTQVKLTVPIESKEMSNGNAEEHSPGR